MWPVHIPKLATFQAYCFLSFHPHKHTHHHHYHQQPPPTTIAWPPQRPLCTPTTMTVWQCHIIRWMNNDNGQPWPGMCHIVQMVMTHVVVTVLIIPGEQCIPPTPLLLSHEKQGFPLPMWLAHQQMCHIVWAVTMHVVITVLIITGEQPPFCFSYQMWGGTSRWQCGNHMTQDKQWVMTMTNDNDKWLHNNNNRCCHHHSESLHPTSSLPYPTNIPPPPDKGQWPQPCHPFPATISHDHNWSWSQQQHDKMTMQQPQHDNIMHWPLASPLLFCSHFPAIILDSHSSTM